MILKNLSLSNYRNLSKVELLFSPELTFIVGPNSVGKTNLLESIYLLLTGHGIKEDKQEELVAIGQTKTDIESSFVDDNDVLDFRIVLDKQEKFTKRYFVNTIERRYAEFSKYLPVPVLFAPQIIEAITTQPSRRRELFDQIISTVDTEYKKRLINYSGAITKRNKILERQQYITNIQQELSFWNNFLCEQSVYICQKRIELTEFFNQSHHVGDYSFSLEYVQNPISVRLLEDTLDEQLRRRSTFFGPQRDDYKIILNDFDVVMYGSRSQQRLSLFWIMLSQLRLYKDRIDKTPILLLDDIFSELDEVNSHLVIDVIKDYQTIITTNNVEIQNEINKESVVINLS